MLLVPLATLQEATSLISVAKYRALTNDTASSDADINSALVEGLSLIEEYLRRKLPVGTWTESLIPVKGVVYPSNTPVLSTPEEGVSVLDEVSLYLNSTPLFGRKAVVTYVGGYTAETLPSTLLLAIAQAAQSVLNPVTASTAGARSVSVGDVSLSYGTAEDAGGVGGLPSAIRRMVRKWKVKFI